MNQTIGAAKTYIGTKIIKAFPMNRQDYNDYRGWQLPSNENGADDGYLVEYQDGGVPNDSRHNGYISWSPKEQFENAYHSTHGGMSFGHALVALETGERVCRSGWNGKGMWLVLVRADSDKGDAVVDYTLKFWMTAGLDATKFLPWIGMKTADGGFVPWLASQTDMLAKDWEVVQMEHQSIRDDRAAVDYHVDAAENATQLGYDAELNVESLPSKITGNHLHGLIYNDRKARFIDGTYVTTSVVREWYPEEDIAVTDSGTRYLVRLIESGKRNG